MTDALRARIVKRAPTGFTLDVDLDVPPGITVLFGPSGAGKSTALQCIAGLKKPDEGRVSLGDDVWFDADSHRDRAVHERGVGYVFQSLALFPHMTALANVEYGVPANEDKRNVATAMLERMKVGHLASRRPSTFSGGESQRVALARAFASSPRALLLDEAFSAMDRELRRDLLLDLRRTVEEKPLPVVLVTHMRNEARTVGDRVILVRDGRVDASGDVEALLGTAGSGSTSRAERGGED